MRFEILGPMRVRCDGREVQVAGRLQQVLLGVLLSRANTVVSSDVLADALWGERRNDRVTANLHVHVHRLRRSVGLSDRLSSAVGSPGGYHLRLEPGELDAERFEALVRTGLDAAATDPLRAALLIREALRIWQGEPFRDTDVPLLADESRRLTESRLSGIEELYAAELSCGRHAAVIGELAEHVRHHPLRERLRGLLMLALDRLGRRAEALEVYHAGRRHLVDELGIDPGSELQRVHQLILTSAAGEPTPVGERAATLVSGRQEVLGPGWVYEPPRRVAAAVFGVTMNSTTGAMPDFRVGAVRLWDCRCRWANVQPRKDSFDWTILDRQVTAAAAADLPVTYTMGMPAGWACPDGKQTPYTDDSRAAPPDDLDDWDAYVRAVVTRYRGRIEAYELWDYVTSPLFYAGSIDTLVELVRRASRIIRTTDRDALVLGPSFGDLWDPAGQQKLLDFAVAGGYECCDVAALKLHPPEPSGRPETMVDLVELIDRIKHKAGTHVPLWSTGPEYASVTFPRLAQERAGAYAVRHYLAAICAQVDRLYFYSWGARPLPLVLQPDGGPPTQAASFVERLQLWLDDARVRSYSNGTNGGLPPNVWQLRLAMTGPDPHEAVIRWTDGGTACMVGEPGVRVVEHLDGTCQRLDAGVPMMATEQPVLVRYREQM